MNFSLSHNDIEYYLLERFAHSIPPSLVFQFKDLTELSMLQCLQRFSAYPLTVPRIMTE